MRSTLHAGTLPFDGCKSCAFLRNDGEHSFAGVDQETWRVRPLCVRLPARRETKGPPDPLDLEMFNEGPGRPAGARDRGE